MQATIIDRGRGPEIAGTRITVHDLLDYIDLGWDDLRIAILLGLGTDQVAVGRAYIKEHEPEVRVEYQVMLDRCARGNPPEVQAKLDAARARFRAWLADWRENRQPSEAIDAGIDR